MPEPNKTWRADVLPTPALDYLRQEIYTSGWEDREPSTEADAVATIISSHRRQREMMKAAADQFRNLSPFKKWILRRILHIHVLL